ncbi:helix-turn-helix domain-containing protein [Streptosporangium saharense]|uniref:AraC-like ligand-binding domain-containing protein n=1 Tax=Streptosporangium saharense TaxID=1706840 RepID=UPI00342D44D8
MPTLVSTAGLPPREQVEFWRNVVSDAFGPLQLRAGDTGGFAGRIASRTLGPVQVSDVRAPAHVVSRAARHITTRGGRENYKFCLLLRGSGVIEQAGRRVVASAGDLVFYDLSRPMELVLDAHHLLALTVPRSAIPLPAAHVADLAGTLLASRQGPGRLTVSFLTALAAEGDAVDGPHGQYLGEAIVNMVTSALSERLSGESPVPGAGAELLQCITDWIERNLHRPDLSPAVIAHAHHVSVRQLHRIFHAAGMTVAAHVRTRRMDRCRRELSTAHLRADRVSSIAARWGFSDAASFSRAFRRIYGCAPSDYRAALADEDVEDGGTAQRQPA